ncbi:hypothetical protein FF098_014960 [Parvularcula flava]|uniref:Uncharacterized protein n=1 Tax=Aquisalinus luteolus TaxID=1566827 RepID=A0A8J3A574_9PROT|nr:hypothetical protein [Aquisalinus luteolus]NHK29218.1 hypothetical protein [Aquisalinus luteolus]GGH99930.1 hypothetical protein GCM10011355_27030 [Aquisalinus luteolus]
MTYTNPFQEGETAFDEGKPVTANPYDPETMDGKDWILGWQAGERTSEAVRNPIDETARQACLARIRTRGGATALLRNGQTATVRKVTGMTWDTYDYCIEGEIDGEAHRWGGSGDWAAEPGSPPSDYDIIGEAD